MSTNEHSHAAIGWLRRSRSQSVKWHIATAIMWVVLNCATGCGNHKETSVDAVAPELAQEQPSEDSCISIVQILAHRDRYHGKKVQVKGFLRLSFEGTAIFLSKDDAYYSITENGFWVRFDRNAVPYEGNLGPVEFDGKYVLIEGMFDKENRGHCGLFQGTIKNIDRILEQRRRDHPGPGKLESGDTNRY